MNKKHIVSLVILLLVLIGGVVYHSYKPESILDIEKLTIPKENVGKDLNSIGKQNLDDKTLYYRIGYRWSVTKESGDEKREGMFFTVKDVLATSTDIFIKDAETIVSEIASEHNANDGTLKSGSFEIFAIDILVCDKDFNPQQVACYDGINKDPQILQK